MAKDKDDILSREEFSVIDLVCEGPIEGPVDKFGKLINKRFTDAGAVNADHDEKRDLYESIYLNDIPIKEYKKPKYNFRYVAAEYRAGSNEKNQVAMVRNYFQNQSANIAKQSKLIGHVADGTTNDGGELVGGDDNLFQGTEDAGAIPLTHYIGNPDVDSLIITVNVTLTNINKDGESIAIPCDLGITALIQGDSKTYNIVEQGWFTTTDADFSAFGKTGSGADEAKFITKSAGKGWEKKVYTGGFAGFSNLGPITLDAEDGGPPHIIIKGLSQSGARLSFKIDLSELRKYNQTKNPIILKFYKLNSEGSDSQSARGKTTRNIRIDYITEQISEKLSFPHSAMFGITIDSRGFSSEPRRSYDLKLLKIKVPSNYVPWTENTQKGETLYYGIWDGTFHEELMWTCNPAWIFYDLLTNPRYGLGRYGIKEDHIDKWALYEIARYCDAVNSNGTYKGVPTGFSVAEYGVDSPAQNQYPKIEPRFTCNVVLNQKQEALELLQNFASIFNGMVYWGFGALSLVSDLPKDPTMFFTNSDVTKEGFNYSDSAKTSRATVIKVRYNDRHDNFKPKIEYKEDAEAIQKYGIIEQDTIAFGCTSRGQAQRMAKWVLYSNLLQKESISFKGGLKCSYLRPGDIIKIYDIIANPQKLAGRIASVDYDATKIKIDIPIFNLTLPIKIDFVASVAGGSPSLAYDSDEAQTIRETMIHQAFVIAIDETRTVLTLRGVDSQGEESGAAPDFLYKLRPGLTWMINDENVNVEAEFKEFKVMSVTEQGNGLYGVVGLEYFKGKYDIVDQEANINLREYGFVDADLFAAPKIPSPTITGRITKGGGLGSVVDIVNVTIYQTTSAVDFFEVQIFENGIPISPTLGVGIQRVDYDPSIAPGEVYPDSIVFLKARSTEGSNVTVKARSVKDHVYSSATEDEDGIYGSY